MFRELTGEHPAINRSTQSDIERRIAVTVAKLLVLPGLAVIFATGLAAKAEDIATFELTLQDHAFAPTQLKVPAGKPFKLTLHNSDSTPAEFESKTLKFEKVVAGSSDITVQVRALDPGKYQFYDEYHEDEAVGYVVVE
jgi:plastocyanin